MPPGNVTIEDVLTIHVATNALDSFRSRHGGGDRDAEVQLRSMLEDFLLKSARRVSKGGLLKLSREGYVLTLSPGRDSIIGYSTIHRERTWEQVKAGVKSRFKQHGKAREASGPPPERGSMVPLSEFATIFDPAAVHLTARARGSYAKIAGLAWVSDEELDAAIRAACTELDIGNAAQRDDGLFEVRAADLLWLVSPDCRSLFRVSDESKPHVEPDQSIDDGRAADPDKLKTASATKRSRTKPAKDPITKKKKKSKGAPADDALLQYWNSDRAKDESIDSRPKSPWLGVANRVRGITSGGLPGHGKRH